MLTRKYTILGFVNCWLLLFTTVLVSAQQAPPATGGEAELLAVLQSDAPLFNKAKACQQLAVIGTKDSVPVLAKLLADRKLAHYARFGLESNPDPAVDEALRNATRSLKGVLLVGVINSIGVRRDAQAVTLLEPLLSNPDPDVAAAAAAALGRIASPESVVILTTALATKQANSMPLRKAIGDACLTAGDMLAKVGKTEQAITVFETVQAADVPRYMQLAALAANIRTRGADGVELIVKQLQSEDPERFAIGLSMAPLVQDAAITKALIAELKKPFASPAADAKTLVILAAKYGIGDKWVDVTEKLMNDLQDGGISIVANNAIAGDPAPSTKKELRVKYKLGADTTEIVIPEGQSLKLEGTLPRNPRHVKVIAILRQRGDKAALPAVLDAAKEAPWDVRLEAIRALATLGGSSTVPLLLDTALADEGALSDAALASLADIPDETADKLIEQRLEKCNGHQQQVLLTLIGLREISSAVPTLFELAGSSDRDARRAAIGALGLTVQLGDFPRMVEMLLKSPSPEMAAAVKSALQKACQRMPDRDATSTILLDRMKNASFDAKADLLDLLGVVGGEKALAGVAKAAQSDDEQLVDAATQVLGKWMSADAAPVLLELARSGNPKFRIRALRGYIRIPRQLNVTPEQKLAMSIQALETATRDQERVLILRDVLARIYSSEALELATRQLQSPGSKEAACEAAIAIAAKIARSQPTAVAAAMPKVIAATNNKTLVRKARGLLRQTER